MSKITRDELTDLISATYIEHNNGDEFGDNTNTIINNMILIHGGIIMDIINRINHARIMIGITELAGVIGILICLFQKSISFAILESVICTTITVLLFDFLYKLKVRNYLKNVQIYVVYHLSIIYHYIVNLDKEENDTLIDAYNRMCEIYYEFLNL